MTHVPDGGGFGARFYKSTAMSAYFAEAVLDSDSSHYADETHRVAHDILIRVHPPRGASGGRAAELGQQPNVIRRPDVGRRRATAMCGHLG
jgi:hypothetical protein